MAPKNGGFGGDHVSTPRIDQMAAEGARLTNFYVAAPLCKPSRAALMTGCYPKRIDMAAGSRHAVLLSADSKGLNPDEITIAEVLKSAGYATGMFGKWHLGDQPEFLPTRQGFDEFFGIPYSHDIHPFHPRQKHHQSPPLPLLEGEQVTAMDLLPTFAKLAGAKVPSDRVIDGKDIWPTLVGNAGTPHEAFFYHRRNALEAVRSGKWKLHLNKGKPAQLHDLEGDIGEKQNLIENHPEIAERLRSYAMTFQNELSRNSRPAGMVTSPKPLTK